DFSISISASAQGVTVGDKATFTVTTAVVSGSPGTLTLAVGRLPAGLTGTVDPSSLSAGQSATVTIAVDRTADAGDFTITVGAADGDNTHTASASLTVNLPPPPPPPPDAPPPPPPPPTPTGFRLNGMCLRDPHVFISILGKCYDATDSTPFGVALNSTLNSSLSADTNPADGFIDLSPVVVFTPLDPTQATTPMDFDLGAKCSAPAGASTTCTASASPLPATASNQTSGGVCLGTVAGTTSGYSPPVASPSGECFVSDSQTLAVTLQGTTITLHNAQIGAAYDGSNLTNGLIMGFLLQSDADKTSVPLPILGNVVLSSILGGG